MGKKRIYELAKEINKNSKEIVEKAQALGMEVKNHMGVLSNEEEGKLRQAFSSQTSQSEGNKKTETASHVPPAKAQPAAKKSEPVRRSTQRSSSQVLKPKVSRAVVRQGTPQGGQNTAKQGDVVKKTVDTSVKDQTQQSVEKKTSESKQQVQAKPKVQQNNVARPANHTADKTSKPAVAGNKNTNTRDRSTDRPQNQNFQKKPSVAVNSNTTKDAKYQGGTEQSPAKSDQRNQKKGGKNYSNNNNDFRQNRRNNKKGKKGKRQPESQKPAVPPRKFRELPEVLVYTEGMTVADLAKKLHREPAEIIKKFFMMGVMATQNQSLDKDSIELLAADYGIEAEEKVQVDVADIDKFFDPENISQENLVSRPPVVTIMGHVDHGKTTLLDTLRHSKVSLGEAGGITQHIGAYQIEVEGKTITFLDTPGHAAFTSMRARGAKITDITILVVAADDGVMPQTIEAINHAKAAEVPIIVAVNKIDKPGANPDRVMQELSEHGLIPEDWGGDTIFVKISAKFNENIDELLEMVLLVAEVEDLKADPTQHAIGTVIEARLDKGKGPIATLLVQQGTLRVGDPIVAGNTFGRVRVMVSDIGRREKAAGPATPVEITGLNDVPQAGDHFVVYEDEKTARAAGEERAKRALIEQRSASSRVTLDNLFESLKEGELKEVNVIIKADVQGSAEALAASLNKIDVEGVRVKIVHSAVGAINESDVTLAEASNAIIIGFNVRPTPQARAQAESDEVDIRLHSIIYKVIEEIETAMKGMLDPEFEERITGQMTVRELYKVSKVGTIAGCYVNEGSILRDGGVRVIRDGIVIYEGKLESLKRFKDDAKEVKLGFECGAMVENFNDLKVDDVIESFVMEEIKG